MREQPKEAILFKAMLHFAEAVSQASACVRAKHGCVLTNPDLQVISYGYNGPAKGLENTCLRPEVPGNCRCVHAEANAIAKAGLGSKYAFITGYPCEGCAALLVNADVELVCYAGPAHREMFEGLTLLDEAEVLHGSIDELVAQILHPTGLPDDWQRTGQSKFGHAYNNEDIKEIKANLSKFGNR